MSRSRGVVLVNQYFPPDTSATSRIATDFIGECERRGLRVLVVAGRPSYDPTARLSWRPVRRSTSDGSLEWVIGSSAFDRRNPIGRVLNYLTFMVGAALVVPMLRPTWPIVVMTDPPMAPLLAPLSRLRNRRRSVRVWIQDLHPDFDVATGLLRNGRLVRVWRRLLVTSLNTADEIIVLGRDMSDRVTRLGVDAPTTVVHNGWSGVDSAETQGSAADTLRIFHFGNVGFAGPFESVVRAMRNMQDHVELVFVGAGANEGVLADAPANVTVRPRIPHGDVAQAASEADLLLVGVRDGVEGLVVPSKGYEMMALGRPLLVVGNPGSEMRRLVTEIGCGLGCDDNPESIAAVLNSADTSRDSLADMARKGLLAAVQYRRDVQFGPFVDRIERGDYGSA